MNRIHRAAARVCVIALLLSGAPRAGAQQQDEKPPARPPEVERLVQLAKDPDRLRQALSDPQQVEELMDLAESDAVREFARDPQNLLRLMTEVNPGQIRDVIQSIDPSVVRRAMASRWMERLRKQLGATDEEWKVLAPKVENLLRAQQEARAGVRGVRPGGNGAPGGGRSSPFANPFGPGAEETSEVEYAAETVRMAVRAPEIPERDTALALAEYRKARDKARARLADAERELRELITQRQEAVLVLLGVLE